MMMVRLALETTELHLRQSPKFARTWKPPRAVKNPWAKMAWAKMATDFVDFVLNHNNHETNLENKFKLVVSRPLCDQSRP